jgi:hypothetical protein
MVFGFAKFSAQVSAEQLSQPPPITPIGRMKQVGVAFGEVLFVSGVREDKRSVHIFSSSCCINAFSCFVQHFVSPLNFVDAAIYAKVNSNVALNQIWVPAVPQPIHVLFYTVVLARRHFALVFNGHGLLIQRLGRFGFHVFFSLSLASMAL